MDQQLQSVTVWYRPQLDQSIKPGSVVIFDGKMSASFEVALNAGTQIDSDVLRSKFRPSEWQTSHCRAQIFAHPGTTDVRTADTMSRFFRAVEDRDGDAVERNLMPNLTTDVPEGLFQGVTTTNTREAYMEQLIAWSEPFAEIWFDVTQAFISTDKALMEFRLWCEGEVVGAALTQYRFGFVDGNPVISGIYNHSNRRDSVITTQDDGTLQWTAQP